MDRSILPPEGDIPPELMTLLGSNFPWLMRPPAPAVPFDPSGRPVFQTPLQAGNAGPGPLPPTDPLAPQVDRFRQVMGGVLGDVMGPDSVPPAPEAQPLPEQVVVTPGERKTAAWSDALGGLAGLLQNWQRGSFTPTGAPELTGLRSKVEKNKLERAGVEQSNRDMMNKYRTETDSEMRRRADVRARVMDPAIRAISEAIFPSAEKAQKPPDIETRIAALKQIQNDPNIPPAQKKQLIDLIIPGSQEGKFPAADVQTAQFLQRQPWFQALDPGLQQELILKATGSLSKAAGGAGNPNVKGLSIQERYLWHLDNDAFGDSEEAMKLAEADIAGLQELTHRQASKSLVSGHGMTVTPVRSPMPGVSNHEPYTPPTPRWDFTDSGVMGQPPPTAVGTPDHPRLKRLALAYAANKERRPNSAEDMRQSFIRQYGVDPELILGSWGQ